MRIAIAKIFQETDTFSPVLYTLDDFQRFGIFYGEEILERFKDIGELGGFISVAQTQPETITLLPIINATAWAGGRLKSEAFQFLSDSLINGLEKAEPFDGILLSLHGAMCAEDIDDCVGYLLGEIRRNIGQDIPIIVTLDHHANITKEIIKNVDGLVGYRKCPHTDTFETGVRAANLLFKILRREVSPKIAWKKIPMITPIDKFLTDEPPLLDWFSVADKYASLDNVLSISQFPVQPWLDVNELGWSTVVITDRDIKLAEELAEKLSDIAWEMRKEFFSATLVPPSEAIREANNAKQGPIIIADGSDNMNSGAPGDSTCLLKEMLAQSIDCIAYITIVDPEAVEMAINAGYGSQVTLTVGGKRDHIFSSPVEITGRVCKISRGEILSTGHLPIKFDMGRTVLFEIGSIKLVISEYPGPSHEPNVYRHLGLDPEKAKIVVVKTPVGFRVAYKSISKNAIIADTPGLSTPHLEVLPYSRIPRPIFPFDPIENWKSPAQD